MDAGVANREGSFPKLAWLTRDDMREIDRVMVEDLGISLVQMMENAGRHLATVARAHLLGGDVAGRRVLILTGTGGNGGGGLVAARRLHAWGANVRVVVAAPRARYAGVPREQIQIVGRLGIDVVSDPVDVEGYDLVIDALVGYSLNGRLRGRVEELARWGNQQSAPILSLDVPSGLDASTGETPGEAIDPSVTMTLAMPKAGLVDRTKVGRLFLADIGVPPDTYQRVLGREVAQPFTHSDLVEVW
ncbi:MAG: NAD(P)H-hydrate epimerase [Actinobacteria bacterium]|nr:NAD(P)H-hydrate epimerase [Actinomycetota bacterium]